MAASAGVSPYDDFTPIELLWMTEAKETQRWDHTSAIIAMIHNVNAKRQKTAFDFHPYRKKKKNPNRVSLAKFKAELMKDKKRKERGASDVSRKHRKR